ncbi:MAG TPA: DUF4038 domain-containing protein, partial [Puia sp.]
GDIRFFSYFKDMKRFAIRNLLSITIFCCQLAPAPAQPASTHGQSAWTHGRLEVSRDGHYLQYSDGTPFFWLGDTGWELFHRLTLEEIRTYLDHRANKGFNVVQAVALGACTSDCYPPGEIR